MGSSPIGAGGDTSAWADGCFNCRQLEAMGAGTAVAPRDAVFVGSHWRVAHAWGSLPGWMVVISNRHVLSVGELTADEAADLGPLLRALSSAIERVTGCAKTYVVSYGEVDGFDHLHIHVVPRAVDLPEGERGGAIFAHLKVEPPLRVPEPERDRVANEVGALVASSLGRAPGDPGGGRRLGDGTRTDELQVGDAMDRPFGGR